MSSKKILDELANDIRGCSKDLVAGDFDAWAQDWGCSRINALGRVVRETFAYHDLVLLIESNTFSRVLLSRAGVKAAVLLLATTKHYFAGSRIQQGQQREPSRF